MPQGGWCIPCKKDRVLVVKIVGLVTLRVFSLRRSTTRALAVPSLENSGRVQTFISINLNNA